MTLAEVIYQRRVRVLEHAAKTSPTEACRVFGVSRTAYYKWLTVAKQYGLAALMPKPRGVPCQPNATPPWQIEIILAEAIARPTVGARQLLEPLAGPGSAAFRLGGPGHPATPQPGQHAQRVAVLAPITAAADGLVTDQALERTVRVLPLRRPTRRFGGHGHLLRRPAQGYRQGLPTHRDRHRDTLGRRRAGRGRQDRTGHRADFLDLVIERLAAVDIEVTGVLTDNGPEFIGRDFTDHLTALTVDHHPTPPRSPNHNAVCERFQGTALDEFYRPALHRQRFDRLRDLDNQLQGWLDRYNTRRRNHSQFMRGRTAVQVLRSHLKTAAQPHLRWSTRHPTRDHVGLVAARA